MKKNFLAILPLLAANFLHAQNTFPNPGNVGIGTTTPTDLLYINANSQRKGITINGDGDANAYTDITFSINNISSVSSGLPLGWDISHRKDGYFSNTPNGQSSLEFYTYLNGGRYYAPLSFKPDGNVILASTKNALGGKVGIGLTNPPVMLSVQQSVSQPYPSLGTASGALFLTNWDPNYGLLQGVSNDGNVWMQAQRIDGNPIAYNLILNSAGGNVGIGTTDPGAYKLAVKGTIHSQAVQVDMNNWNDYVFDKEYHLTSLKDVKNYLDQNHHLPEIPSAAQVAKDGINLGEMNAKLLKKIEELTLYLIDEHQNNQQQKVQIESQSNQITLLKTQFEALLKQSQK